MTKRIIIAGDIGATKCAVAMVEYDPERKEFACIKHTHSKLRDYLTLEEMIIRTETILGIKFSEADAICIGAAGVYDGEQLRLESGYPYAMPFATIAKQYHWPEFAIIHDYAPVVCSTFTSYISRAEHLKKLNAYEINTHGRRVALGVGTGLGVKDGVLLPDGDFWLGTNEMGHIGITHPPTANKTYHQRHQELINFMHGAHLINSKESLTFEKILSGQGTVRLHQFLHPSEKNLTPEIVGSKIREGKASDTLAMFAWYLGLFIGTVQLCLMPDGGVWITGGVVMSHQEVFDHPEFFQGIYASPAYWQLRKHYPLTVLHHPEHVFMGGAYYAVKRLLKL